MRVQSSVSLILISPLFILTLLLSLFFFSFFPMAHDRRPSLPEHWLAAAGKLLPSSSYLPHFLFPSILFFFGLLFCVTTKSCHPLHMNQPNATSQKQNLFFFFLMPFTPKNKALPVACGGCISGRHADHAAGGVPARHRHEGHQGGLGKGPSPEAINFLLKPNLTIFTGGYVLAWLQKQ